MLNFPWIYVSSLLCFPRLYIWFLKSRRQKLPQFYMHHHSWSFWLTSLMTGPAKLANKMCAASIARMNSTNKISIGSKQAKPSHTIFVWTLIGKASVEMFNVQWLSRVKPKLSICCEKVLKWEENEETTYSVFLLLFVFSPWAGLGRDQSTVRRLVWLW